MSSTTTIETFPNPRPGRDYEIDRSRLPEGYVMMDEFRIDFP